MLSCFITVYRLHYWGLISLGNIMFINIHHMTLFKLLTLPYLAEINPSKTPDIRWIDHLELRWDKYML